MFLVFLTEIVCPCTGKQTPIRKQNKENAACCIFMRLTFQSSVYFRVWKLPDLSQDIKASRPFSRHQSLTAYPRRGLHIWTSHLPRHNRLHSRPKIYLYMLPACFQNSWISKEEDGWCESFCSSQWACNLTWEMDLPCAQLRGVQLFIIFF